MKRSQRLWVAVSGMAIVAVTAGLWWWRSRSLSEVAMLVGSATVVGVAAGWATQRGISQRTRRAVKALPVLIGIDDREFVVPKQLPPPPEIFVGRDKEHNELLDRLTTASQSGGRRKPAVLVIHGESGVGKSALAWRVSAAASRAFADGVVYTSLTGLTADGARRERLCEILGDLVDSLQGPGDKVPTGYERRQRVFRRLSRRRRRSLRRRRMLYVFDGVPDEDALREIMPAGRASVVLVTAHNTLGADGLALARLDPPHDTNLVTELLATLVDFSPENMSEGDWAIFAEIVRSTHGNPFALHLAARAIGNHGLAALRDIVTRLSRSQASREDEMLELSVAALTPILRRTLLSLAWLTEPTFVPWMVAAVEGIGEDEAWNRCARLADQRLLERITADATGLVELRMPTRVLEYVQRQAKDAELGQARAALQNAERVRRLRDLPNILETAIEYMNKGQLTKAVEKARDALAEARARSTDRTLGELSAAERQALGVLAEITAEMGGLSDALEFATAEHTARTAAGLAELVKPTDGDSVRLWRVLGRLRRRELRLTEAIEILEAARRVAEDNGDVAEQALCLREIAIAESAQQGDATELIGRAYGHLKVARELVEAAGSLPYLRMRLAEGQALVHVNHVRVHDAHPILLHDAMSALDEAYATLPSGYLLWEAWLDYHRARVHNMLAEADRAEQADAARGHLLYARQYAQSAIELFAASLHNFGVARSRIAVGLTYEAEGRASLALPLLEEASETLYYCGDRWVEALAALALGRLHAKADPNDVEAARSELKFAHETFHALGDRRHGREAGDLLASLEPRQWWRIGTTAGRRR